MLLVIGRIELNSGPRDQDKEVRSEFSINVPDDFEFVGPLGGACSIYCFL